MKLFRRLLFIASFWYAVLLPANANASEADITARLNQANEAYRSGNYEKAYSQYEEALKVVNAPELYYDMGNAAFKMGKLGLAVLNFERAKKFDPRDPDILANLSYVTNLIEYRVEDKRSWYVQQLDRWLAYVRLKERFLAVSVVYFLLMVGWVTLLLLRKQFSFTQSNIFLLLFLGMLAFATAFKFYGEQIRRTAVVTEAKVSVRFGPSKNDKLAFSLMEGIEADIVDQTGNWYRIMLQNGESGWAPQEGFSII